MKFKRLLATLLIAFSLMCGNVYANSVVLGWDANTDQIDGYMVYRTLSSGNYSYGINSPNFVGMIPCTANDPVCAEYSSGVLPWGTTFYWVVTAFRGPTAESGPSNEVTHTTPVEPVYPPSPPTGCIIKSIIQ